jgi:hypothetical protein
MSKTAKFALVVTSSVFFMLAPVVLFIGLVWGKK